MLVKTITLQEFKNEMPETDLTSLSNSIKASATKSIQVAANKNNSGENLIILTDNIKKISDGSRASYTFAIKQENGQRATFKNLTIDSSKSGLIVFIATYRPFKDWVKKYKKNKNIAFEGKLSVERIAYGNNLPQIQSNKKGISVKSECDNYWVYNGSQNFNCPCDNHSVGQACNCPTQPYTQYYYSLASICRSGSTTVTTSSANGGSGGGSSSPYPTTAVTLPPGYNPDCENGGMSVSAVGDGDCPLDNPNSQLIAKVNHLALVLNLEYFQSEILADNEWLVNQLYKDIEIYPVDDAFRASTDLAITLASSSNPQIDDPGWMESVLYASLPAAMRPHIEIVKRAVKFEVAMVYSKEPHLRTLTHTYPMGGTIPSGQIIALYKATREAVHLFLDLGGAIPVVGEVLDLTNGFLYSLEGDWSNASLSYAGTIPIVGVAATAGRIARKTIDFANGRYTKLLWIPLSNGNFSFGSRKQLRTVLQLADSRQAHHLVPWELGGHDVIQEAAKNGFHMNEALNGLPVSTAIHNGSHAAYNTKVFNAMEDIKLRHGNGLTPEIAKSELSGLINRIKTEMINNPNTLVDDLIF